MGDRPRCPARYRLDGVWQPVGEAVGVGLYDDLRVERLNHGRHRCRLAPRAALCGRRLDNLPIRMLLDVAPPDVVPGSLSMLAARAPRDDYGN